ncbi:GGDEF domain-containing protein [Shewanella sp. NIFS-20-20]|uniref:GGDEF domain-containing protein n=1 Tax=Shewanella sp. NIFS-20-20 TaxID=2853806 RepID=UPI001C449373|nr:GGDEF domain-containing protein [Shewanella sp. NIFS-20-20]MBV7315577.1 GGDEF domain-containing protein [Shewanella sp. NIFS-20-20]
MQQTEQTLVEQLHITEAEIEFRKSLFSLSDSDIEALTQCKRLIEDNIDELVESFYKMQTDIAEIALLIGDSDTLMRLRNAQKQYVLDLFNGNVDLEYINNRLRIGLVHKRIGVEPKLYLSAVHSLKFLIIEMLTKTINDTKQLRAVTVALDKLVLFDVNLVFDTYIRSLVSEIKSAKLKAELYAQNMENMVKDRTRQLEELSQTDPLTSLLNVRHLDEIANRLFKTAQRRQEFVCAIYLDIDNFKLINDTLGHQAGDDTLCLVANTILANTRVEDYCFRYGGDEFLLLLPACNHQQAEADFMLRILKHIEEQTNTKVRLSYGIAETGPEQFCSTKELIQAADRQMYKMKRSAKSD